MLTEMYSLHTPPLAAWPDTFFAAGSTADEDEVDETDAGMTSAPGETDEDEVVEDDDDEFEDDDDDDDDDEEDEEDEDEEDGEE